MMAGTPRCDTCRHFVPFTLYEANLIDRLMKEHGKSGYFIGACRFKAPWVQRLVRRLIRSPLVRCGYHMPGRYVDLTGLQCPDCGRGEVTVVRAVSLDRDTVTRFGCSNRDCDGPESWTIAL
ncbi:MAG: hypothetical protein M1582_04035, partial [Actinobacteria bacterium]|nr:hypothetical protein [Actinomycetota bacterium]